MESARVCPDGLYPVRCKFNCITRFSPRRFKFVAEVSRTVVAAVPSTRFSRSLSIGRCTGFGHERRSSRSWGGASTVKWQQRGRLKTSSRKLGDAFGAAANSPPLSPRRRAPRRAPPYYVIPRSYDRRVLVQEHAITSGWDFSLSKEIVRCLTMDPCFIAESRSRLLR